MVSCYGRAAACFAAAFLSLAGGADILRWQVTGVGNSARCYAWIQTRSAAEKAIGAVCPAWTSLGAPGSAERIFRQELLDWVGSPTASYREILATGFVLQVGLPLQELDETRD